MFPSLSVLTVLAICIVQFCLTFEIDLPSLPDVALKLIPECALECIEDFVAENLFSCDDPTSLQCLCQAISADTYTLDEGAFYCLEERCDTPTFSKYSGVYGLCGSVSNAQPNTHTRTIFQPPPPSSATTSSDFIGNSPLFAAATTKRVSTSTTIRPAQGAYTSTFIKSAAATITSTSMLPSHTSARSSAPTVASTFSTSPSITLTGSSSVSSVVSIDARASSTSVSVAYLPSETPTVSSPTAAATSSAAGPAPVLGTGQIAGIAVAGTVAAATAIGLILYIFCGKRLRRQKRRRDSDASFGGSHILPSDSGARSDEEQMLEAPKAVTPLIPQAPRPYTGGPKQNQVLGLPFAPNQHRQNWQSRRNISDGSDDTLKPETPSQIGVAKHLTPRAGGISQDDSPGSEASYRTTSRLLPEKPAYYPVDRNVHEKKASNDTSVSQPSKMGSGPGLRIIAPTPEPFEGRSADSYHLYEHPPRTDSNRALKKEPSMEGTALKGKLSDPFLNKPHEQPDLARAAMFAAAQQAARASRSSLPRINTVPVNDGRASPSSQRLSHSKGVPNFRQLVKPRRPSEPRFPQYSPPPQLPNVTPFSPISPELATNTPAGSMYMPQNGLPNSSSIMNRPRPTPNPFFSSHPSQSSEYRPYRSRSRKLRPETHYTTGSETSFEDEDPSPLSPPEPPHMHIAELPALSPVAESPISRATGAQTATRAPSPKVQLTPPSNEERTTPLSRLRYPEIPGSTESPKREVGTVPLIIGLPREARIPHISELHKASVSPLSQSQSPLQRQHSTGSTIISPGYESPTNPQNELSPRLLTSPHQKPKLIPSPLRPARGRDSLRQQEEKPLPPPPPPKDDPATSYPSPSTTAASTNKFHQAARRLGSMDATTQGLGNWPVQPTRPVELPARNSGLGNWPVQPTRFSRQVAPPRPQIERERERQYEPQQQPRVPLSQLPTPDATFASSTLRAVPQEPAGRVVVPGPPGKFMHAPQLLTRPDMPPRKAPSQVRPSEQRRRQSGENSGHVPPPDPRREMYRLRELERRREFERQYERQQLDASRQLSDYDVSLGAAPLLPSKGGFNHVQARRELLGGGFDLQNPRGM